MLSRLLIGTVAFQTALAAVLPAYFPVHTSTVINDLLDVPTHTQMPQITNSAQILSKRTETIIPELTISYPIGPFYNMDVIEVLEDNGNIYFKPHGSHDLPGIIHDDDGGQLYGPFFVGLEFEATLTGDITATVLAILNSGTGTATATPSPS